MSTIRDNQKYLFNLYSSQNTQLSWDYMWGYLCRTSIYLFESINNKKGTGQDFIKPLSWLIGTSNKYELDVTEYVLKRYPNCCYLCLTNPCTCIKTKKMPAKVKPVDRNDELESKYLNSGIDKENVTFESIGNLLFNIYPHNIIIWNEFGSCFHNQNLLHKIAQLHETLSQYEKGNISLESIGFEIAAVFVWLINTWYAFSNNGNLSNEFDKFYENHCPVCKQKVCCCGKRNERNQGLFNKEIANLIIDILVDLRGSEFEEQSRSYIQYINTAISSKTDFKIRNAVMQAKDFLNKVAREAKSEEVRSLTKKSLNDKKIIVGDFKL